MQHIWARGPLALSRFHFVFFPFYGQEMAARNTTMPTKEQVFPTYSEEQEDYWTKE